MSPLDISKEIQINGFVFLPMFSPDMSTEDIAQHIGKTVDIPALLPNSAIKKVQNLAPKTKEYAKNNQYSGTFGLDEYPLHSDLAHWAIPPRYFILRCRIGTPLVKTRLIPFTTITSTMNERTITRALARPRQKHPGRSDLLRLRFTVGDQIAYRWDSLFLQPANTSATEVFGVFSDAAWASTAMSLTLAHPGDTLIIDNWNMLHGRSNVPPTAVERQIERIYLSELYTS